MMWAVVPVLKLQLADSVLHFKLFTAPIAHVVRPVEHDWEDWVCIVLRPWTGRRQRLSADDLLDPCGKVVDDPHVRTLVKDDACNVSKKRVFVTWPWNVDVQIILDCLVRAGHVVMENTALTTVTLRAHRIVRWEELEAEGILLLANHNEPVVL